MKLYHITSASQFEKTDLEKIFQQAQKIKSGNFNPKALTGKIMATIFYEPSTRTRFSFESSMLRLGGGVISTENAKEFSSAAKGETLEDTIRMVNSYADIIVLRHFNPGASEFATKYSKVPIVSAGDGNGEHPTQALLDLFTIFAKFKKPDFTISMVGDLENGRTIHSLSYLLSLYPAVKIIYVSPKDLAIPKSLRGYLKSKGVKFDETEEMMKPLKNSDVIYQTRIQKERFTQESTYRKYFGRYIIDKDVLKILKKDSIIMHPLPRVNEITPEVDQDKRAYYFEEAANGVYVRMALLKLIFDK